MLPHAVVQLPERIHRPVVASELDGESVRFEVDEGGDHGSARDASFRVELRHAQRRPAHAHGDSRLVPFILQKAGDPVADFPALDFLLLVLVGEEVQRGSGQGLLVRQQLLKHRLGVEDLQHWRMARGRHNLDIELDLLGLRRLRRFGLRLLAYGIDPHLVLQKRRVECRVIEVVEASRHVTSLAGDRVTACRILVVLHCWM
mmetsp:Transcript_5107/g.12898  ORF Transcript_5107/g.12898 Transcript_5107/m.12898 type:complete len:202 (+) Transcript_5107:2725-3330(+)